MSDPTPDSPTDYSRIRHSTSALIARLRSVTESESENDPWLAALCAQSAEEIERLHEGIQKCLCDNAHLADGEDCTLIELKRLVGPA